VLISYQHVVINHVFSLTRIPVIRITYHIIAVDDKVFVMFNTKATNKLKDKTITIKSADLYTISNDMFVEHWDIVETTGVLKIK
jgi:predicted SnoaL-like aldol condensation-catalyzing enzyme